jgi:hypothetical protein
MNSEQLEQQIDQVKFQIQTVRESLAASRFELKANPGRAREIVIENVPLIKAGWELSDELKLLEAELKQHEQ